MKKFFLVIPFCFVVSCSSSFATVTWIETWLRTIRSQGAFKKVQKVVFVGDAHYRMDDSKLKAELAKGLGKLIGGEKDCLILAEDMVSAQLRRLEEAGQFNEMSVPDDQKKKYKLVSDEKVLQESMEVKSKDLETAWDGVVFAFEKERVPGKKFLNMEFRLKGFDSLYEEEAQEARRYASNDPAVQAAYDDLLKNYDYWVQETNACRREQEVGKRLYKEFPPKLMSRGIKAEYEQTMSNLELYERGLSLMAGAALLNIRFMKALDDAQDESTVIVLAGKGHVDELGKRVRHLGWQRIKKIHQPNVVDEEEGEVVVSILTKDQIASAGAWPLVAHSDANVRRGLIHQNFVHRNAVMNAATKGVDSGKIGFGEQYMRNLLFGGSRFSRDAAGNLK